MKIHRTKRLATLLAAAAVSLSATAAPPHLPDLVSDGNKWVITAYFDASPGHTQAGTQTICFFPAGVSGTQQNYVWVSTSYPDWNGRASQEGDQIFMHGDYPAPIGKADGGHDSMDWEIVTASPRNEGTGHWKEWREDGALGRTVGFGNTKLVRVGRCEQQTHAEALEFARQLRVPTDAAGLPLSPTGTPLESTEQ